jgi:hypothetical protein
MKKVPGCAPAVSFISNTIPLHILGGPDIIAILSVVSLQCFVKQDETKSPGTARIFGTLAVVRFDTLLPDLLKNKLLSLKFQLAIGGYRSNLVIIFT